MPTNSPSPSLDHEHYCAEITHQTRLFRDALTGADLAAQVPTCPDWTLRDLAVHLGGAHRWAAEIVRRRASEDVPEETVPGFDGPKEDEGLEALDAWLGEGAELLADVLREAGPDTRVWTWADRQEAGFWARRMTHETVVHRADACLAADVRYEVAAEVAADCVEEWLEIVADPESQEDDPDLLEMRQRAGDSLHLHATDNGDGEGGEWLIELGAEGVRWRRGHARATVAVRGPLTDVLLVLQRRLAPGDPRVEVLGDGTLLDFWLERTSFGG